NGSAVIVCPGGGFQVLAADNEGAQVAHWLTARGTAVFVLRYRLLPTPADDAEFLAYWSSDAARVDRGQEVMAKHVPLAVQDALKAMTLVHENAARWQINPARIGLMGFSAGGVVATGAVFARDAEYHPAFLAMLYSPGWHGFMALDDVVLPEKV